MFKYQTIYKRYLLPRILTCNFAPKKVSQKFSFNFPQWSRNYLIALTTALHVRLNKNPAMRRATKLRNRKELDPSSRTVNKSKETAGKYNFLRVAFPAFYSPDSRCIRWKTHRFTAAHSRFPARYYPESSQRNAEGNIIGKTVPGSGKNETGGVANPTPWALARFDISKLLVAWAGPSALWLRS